MGERVVGKGARSPGCNDFMCVPLFLGVLMLIVVLFFMWVGNGAEGFPADRLHSVVFVNGTASELASASVLSAFYGMLFSIVWVFAYLLLMRAAALLLIVSINIIMILLWFAFGAAMLYNATTCRARDPCPTILGVPTDTSCMPPCTGTTAAEYWVSWAGGIVLVACGCVHLLWLCCIRARLYFTAKILSAVSGVLAQCPGAIGLSLILAAVTCVWYVFWYGAFVEMTNLVADGLATDGVTAFDGKYYGSFVGVLFAMLICLFWGHKVFTNISHMVSAHVVASWYFDPDSTGGGIPCCRPATLTGTKRAFINYLGSIAFGSLLVAILEAIYWTLKFVFDQTTKGQNFVIKMVACCILCLINCLKRTVEWLTEWAYVYIAIYGVGFVRAGGKVASMLMDSGMGAIAQTSLVGPVLFVGKLIAAAAGAGGGFLVLRSYTALEEGEKYAQPILGACVAFAVGSVALACIDAGNKSMYVCYVEAPELMAERVPALNEVFAADSRNKAKNGGGGGGAEMAAAQSKDVDVTIRP